ncbi:hypothetical protein [Serratia marcescens]|uniref:hypothetical protein n=1 Tax=Serratia marcescens TaxID=615 RepID=UPI0038C7621D
MLTSDGFKDYLARMNISPTCLCCGNNQWSAYAGVASNAINSDDEVSYTPVNTLGLVAMTTNQKGHIGYTRNGGIAIAFLTCNSCGHMIPFHYHYVASRYAALIGKQNIEGDKTDE